MGLRGLIFFNLAFIFPVLLFSQVLNDNGNPRGGRDSLESSIDSIDRNVKLELRAFYLDNIFENISFSDTLLDESFPYFDPLEALGKNIVEKGYIGSGAMELGKIELVPGFDLGYHQWDMYEKTLTDFEWYESNMPVTSLFFSPGGDEKKFWVKTKFFKNFNDISLGIDYQRLINSGKYMGQNTKHSGLDIGFWKGDKDTKFNTFFNFITNIHQEEDNGGVLDTLYLYKSNYSIRKVIPVNLTDVVTRKQYYSAVFTEYFRLANSYELIGIKPYIEGKMCLSQGFYKFYDNDVSTYQDSLIYGDLIIDDIGLRNYIAYGRLNSILGLWGVTKKNTYFHFGIGQDYINFEIEPLENESYNLINTYFTGKYGLLEEKIVLDWNTKIYFNDYAGDYKLDAGLKYKNRFLKINGNIQMVNASPALKYQRLYLTRKEVYHNDFDKSSMVKLSVGIDVDKLGFSFDANIKTIDKYLYFADDLLPRQLDKTAEVLSLNIKERIRLLMVHLDLDGYYYKSSVEEIPLPKYTLKTKVYISPYLYNRHLFLKTGFEFNYWDSFYNYGYNPAIASFYVQNKVKLNNYMRLDYFASAKIKKFLIFIRFNNILFPLTRNVSFKVVDYPQNDLFFRLGVKWTMMN